MLAQKGSYASVLAGRGLINATSSAMGGDPNDQGGRAMHSMGVIVPGFSSITGGLTVLWFSAGLVLARGRPTSQERPDDGEVVPRAPWSKKVGHSGFAIREYWRPVSPTAESPFHPDNSPVALESGLGSVAIALQDLQIPSPVCPLRRSWCDTEAEMTPSSAAFKPPMPVQSLVASSLSPPMAVSPELMEHGIVVAEQPRVYEGRRDSLASSQEVVIESIADNSNLDVFVVGDDEEDADELEHAKWLKDIKKLKDANEFKGADELEDAHELKNADDWSMLVIQRMPITS